jgi:hypothetical protein
MSLDQKTDIYYLAFPNDRLGIKCLVYGLALIETLQTAFMGHDAVMALGLGFGNPEALDNVHFAWVTIPLMSSVGQYLKTLHNHYTTLTFCSQRNGTMLFRMENLYSF